MAYEKSKGVLAIATEYSGGKYTYTKIDKFIGKEGHSPTPDQMQDLDSYVNANGLLKRTVLPHSRSKIEINTPYLFYEGKSELIGIIKKGIKLKDGKCIEDQRKLKIRFFNDWTENYSEAYCYVPDITFQYGGTFGDMAYKVEEFAKTSIQQFGMSERTLKRTASVFQAMGTNMGIDPKMIKNANKLLNEQTNGYVELGSSVADVSLTLTKLTADMESVYGEVIWYKRPTAGTSTKRRINKFRIL